MGETCQFHGTCQGLLRECEQLRENDRVVMLELGGVKEGLAAVDSSSRSAHHRIDSMEKHTEAVIRLAVSVEGVTKQLEGIVTKIDNHDDDILQLKSQPGQAAIKAWQWLLVAFAGGCVGMIFTIAANVFSKKLGG